MGNFVYEDGKLAYILTSEGRLIPTGTGTDRKFLYEYTLKDHLGNSRVTFMGTDLGNAIDVVQTNSYYPFGLTLLQNNGNTSDTYKKNKYLYNGKEIQDDNLNSKFFGMLDYGARFYDLQIGRFSTVDPLTEWHFNLAPYNYCKNNPIRFVDINGMEFGDPPSPPPPPVNDDSSDSEDPPPTTNIPEVVIVGHKPADRTNPKEWGFNFFGEDGKNGTNPNACGPDIDFDVISWLTLIWGQKPYETPGKPSNSEIVVTSIEAAAEATDDKDTGKKKTGSADKITANGGQIEKNKREAAYQNGPTNYTDGTTLIDSAVREADGLYYDNTYNYNTGTLVRHTLKPNQ